MIFLPSFLLAIVSTLDLTNKKSLSILISHSYLVLLPTFTYFSYSKLRRCGDRKIGIAFCPTLTVVNTLLGILLLQFYCTFHWILYYALSVIMTLLFLKIEEISCCSCCGSAGRLVRVFDPDHPEKTFIMEGGRVVEVTDLDVEQGEHIEMTGLEGKTEENVPVERIRETVVRLMMILSWKRKILKRRRE